MDKIVESIANNPYLVLVVETATLIALIIAIIIPIVQKRKKRLSFSYVTNVLISENLSEMDELLISFKGKIINHLSVTCFKIINNGNVIIEGNDVYKGHELKISPKKAFTRVISAKIISQSSNTVNGMVSLEDANVNVSFQTFEVKDYLSINIYHTGDEDTEFTMTGKIKETKIIPPWSEYRAKSITKLLLVFLGIVVFGLIIINLFRPTQDGQSISLKLQILISIYVIIFATYTTYTFKD